MLKSEEFKKKTQLVETKLTPIGVSFIVAWFLLMNCIGEKQLHTIYIKGVECQLPLQYTYV